MGGGSEGIGIVLAYSTKTLEQRDKVCFSPFDDARILLRTCQQRTAPHNPIAGVTGNKLLSC